MAKQDIIDTSDVIVRIWGYRYPVSLGGTLLNQSWRGGQFVTFIDDWTVDVADPINWEGFLVRSSFGEEGCMRLQSWNPQVTKGIPMIIYGSYDFMFYETMSVNMRRAAQGLPPLGPPALPAQILTYNISDPVYVSLNGLLTNEQELPGAERAGTAAALPATNRGYLGFIFS